MEKERGGKYFGERLGRNGLASVEEGGRGALVCPLPTRKGGGEEGAGREVGVGGEMKGGSVS